MRGHKRSRKWMILLIIIVLLVGAGVLFRVTQVTVEGNTFYTNEEVEQMFCQDLLDKNTITFFLRDYFGLKKEIPYVREYKAEFKGLGKIHIKLYEKAIVAGVQYMNEYIYFDKEGLVLESSGEKRADIPLFDVTGLTNFALYEKIQLNNKALLERILKISNLLVHYSIKADRILFNSRNEAILYSGKIKVCLGKQEDYDNAVAALQSVLITALEKKMSGEIDLSNYKVGDNIILKRIE